MLSFTQLSLQTISHYFRLFLSVLSIFVFFNEIVHSIFLIIIFFFRKFRFILLCVLIVCNFHFVNLPRASLLFIICGNIWLVLTSYDLSCFWCSFFSQLPHSSCFVLFYFLKLYLFILFFFNFIYSYFF